MLRDELFRQRSDLSIGEISKIQIRLLISHETEIKSWTVALMTRVRTCNSESAHESSCVSRGVQPKRRNHNTIAAASTLHQEVAIPFVGHGQCKGDSKFLAANSCPPIHESLDTAICRKRGAATLVPGNRLGATSVDVSSLSDLDAWNLDVHQSGA